MRPVRNRPLSRRKPDGWSLVKGLMQACLFCAASGILMGGGYYLLAWVFQDSIRSPATSKYITRIYLTTPQIAFLFVSLLFGWISLRMADRFSGLHGMVLMLPVICSYVVAIAVGLSLTYSTITEVNSRFWQAFLMAAIAHVGVGIYKKLREG